MTDPEIHWHKRAVPRSSRELQYKQNSCVLWFTGLSGSGKSTIANSVDHRLHQDGFSSFVLDGDNIRHELNAPATILVEGHSEEFAKRFGLGFSAEDREENIRRIGAVAKLFCDAGIIVLTAFISPYRTDRDQIRNSMDTGDFIEIYMATPLTICEARDTKGLYQKARRGEIQNFTGIDDPYNPPDNPEIILDGTLWITTLADQVIEYLRSTGKIYSQADSGDPRRP